MTSSESEWRHIIYYDILHTRFMQPEAVSYAFKLTAGTNRMTEEQCLRPSDRESCITQQERKRTTGWLAGHEIHLEIEDVLGKNKIAQKIRNMSTDLAMRVLGVIFHSKLSWENQIFHVSSIVKKKIHAL